MIAALDVTGNGSSVHAEGRAVRAIIEEAREAVADLVGAKPENVIFTSGGTEANMQALAPLYRRGSGERQIKRLIVSDMEHPSVLSGGRFDAGQIIHIPATCDGLVDVQALAAIPGLRGDDFDTADASDTLVSVALANGETGIVQPLSQVVATAAGRGALVHTDAIQAVGRMDLAIDDMGVDALSIAAHKIGGPKGVGALVLRDYDVVPAAFMIGGGQEQRRRAGTENVVGIAGFGAAAGAVSAARGDSDRLSVLRMRLEEGLRDITPDAVIVGEGKTRLANTTCFAAPGLQAESLVIAFDLAGIAISAGSACSSGRIGTSHVLQAMQMPANLARAAVRVSLGWTTTRADIDHCLAAWRTIYRAMRKKSGLAA